MTLPTNIGLGSNSGISIDNNISAEVQIQNNQDVRNSGLNVDNSVSLKDLINSNNLKIDTDEVAVNNFISGKNSPANKNVELDLVFSLENNKNNFLSNEVLQNIKNYNLDIISNFYENIENKASMLLSLNNNEESYFSNFYNTISNFNTLKGKISEAILEKSEKVKTNNFENILKNYISSSSNSELFNLLTSSFAINSVKENNEKTAKVLNNVLTYDRVQKIFPAQINAGKFIKKHCLFEANISRDYESKEIRSIINDVNVQNIVTMIRNLYFMSPNSMTGNYLKEEKFNFLDMSKENLRIYTSEFDDIDYFNFINENDNVDFESFLDRNTFKQVKENELTYSRSITLNSSIDEALGKQHIVSNIKSYVNDVMIENFKNVNHIKTTNYSNLGLFPPNSVVAALELNKIFTGDFFEVNLEKYDVLKDVGIQDLISFMLFGNSANNTDNFANRLFKENYLKRSNEIIYRFKSPITRYQNNSSSRNNKGTIISSDRFNLDDSSLHYINDLYTKSMIDNFVKKQKLNFLKNSDVDLQFSREVIENIKKSRINKKLVAYCKEDKQNLSALNTDNQLFKLFFTEDTEDENIFYSHADIVSNHSVEDAIFKGLDNMKSLEIEPNEDYILISNNIKKIISLYYQNNNFFSSSLFFKNILKSMLDEIDVIEDIDYEENNLTQALYFNYFKKDFNEDTQAKKVIAERFLKKAVQLDSISSSAFKRNRSLESFRYMHESVIEDDFDSDSKESVKSYIDQVLSTSENLKKIKSSVFSHKNIKNLSMLSDYKRISNSQIVNNGYSSEFGTNLYAVSSILNLNLIPNYCLLYNFKSSGIFEEDAKVSYIIENKNKVLENITFGDLNQESGEREIKSTSYFVDRSIQKFDVTKSQDILVKVSPRLCINDKNREDHEFPHITIKDNFEKIFINENYSKFAFGKVIDIIQDMLRMSVKDYLKLSISSEGDIDSIVSKNPSLIDEVVSLLELYSEFYLIYTSRIQRLQSLKIFKWQKKEIFNSVFVNGTNNSFPLNGIISNHSSVFSKFKDAMDLDNNDNITIIEKEEVIECFKDLQDLVIEFNQNPNTYLEDNLTEYDSANYKTHITYLCKNIMHSLYLSDFAQAFNFDLVNGFLNHQNKIITLDRNEVSSSNLFSELSNVSEDFAEDLELNFYNSFYLNRLSKVISFISLKNNINYKYIDDCYKKLGNKLHKNKNIFEKIKNHKIDMASNLGSKIENIYNLQNYTFFDRKEDFLNSSFKTFALNNDRLKNKNSKSLIKIKVSLLDKSNLNRLYLPKLYLFSPLITGTNYLTQEILNENNITSSIKKIGFFDERNSLLNRTNIQDIESMLNGDVFDLKNNLKNKFSKINSNEVDLLYKYLISCHVSSSEISDILKYCYSLNVSKDIYKSRISEETFLLVENLSDRQFFDVFNAKKNDILEKIVLDIDTNTYILPKRSNIIEEKCLVYDTLTKLENMASLSEIEDIKDELYYDFYNIAINPTQFYFIDSNSDRALEDEFIIKDDQIKQIEKVFAKINNLDNFNSSNTVFKKSTMSIDNFDIIFEIEVL
jgi:hypothetical protein